MVAKGCAHDEAGKPSLARRLLIVTTTYILLLIGFDSALALHIGSAVWSLLGTMEMAFAGWAAGPRIAQYLLPQLGQLAQGIAAGKSSDRFGGPSMTAFDGDES